MESNGSGDNERARRSLNRALMLMADDVPTAFVPDEEHAVVLVDRTSAGEGLYIQPTSDARIMQFVLSDGTVALDPTSPLYTTPTVDGTWDGIMHLEIVDETGKLLRRQSREWWQDGTATPANTWKYYVTLDRPWQNTTDTILSCRIHQPEFFLRSDVKNILGPARIYDEQKQIIGSLVGGAARTNSYEDYRGEYKARPETYWRTRHVQIQAPTEAPTLEASNATWTGPWEEGTFDFVYTYCWGYRDEEWQESVTGIRDPMWESAPSPSASYSHSTGTPNVKIRFSAPALDSEYGFHTADGSGVHGRGGYYTRIYARRTAVRSAGLGSIILLETSNRYYLLDQYDQLTSANPYYEWGGSIPLDHSRPLVPSTGYYGYSVYPHQDRRYELDFKVSRRPSELIDDQDTAPIQSGKPVEALLQLAAYYHSLQDGVDSTNAERHLANYEKFVNETRSQMNSVDSISPRGYRQQAPRRRWRYEE